MAESSAGLLPPVLSDMILFVSIILSVLLLVAISYIWSTRKQDSEELSRLSADVKILSRKVRDLDSAINMESSGKTLEEVPEAEPFGISVNKHSINHSSTPHNSNDIGLNSVEHSSDTVDSKQSTDEKKISPPWASFVENYNHIAASMAVPGQLKACESFVLEHKLKMLAYGGNMNFIPVADVKDSRFWAWRIENRNRYVVVPNPMIPYDENLHSREGMKETFASNYSDGVYKKYFVELPANLILEGNGKWKISEPGVIKLSRQF